MLIFRSIAQGLSLLCLSLGIIACKQQPHSPVKDVVIIGPGNNTVLFYKEGGDGNATIVMQRCEAFLEIHQRKDCNVIDEQRFTRPQLRRLMLHTIGETKDYLDAYNKKKVSDYEFGRRLQFAGNTHDVDFNQLKNIVEQAIPDLDQRLKALGKKMQFFDNPLYEGTWQQADRQPVVDTIAELEQSKHNMEVRRDQLMNALPSLVTTAQATQYVESEIDSFLDLIEKKGISIDRTYLSSQHGDWISYNVAARIAHPDTKHTAWLKTMTRDHFIGLMTGDIEYRAGVDVDASLEPEFEFNSSYKDTVLQLLNCQIKVDWYGNHHTKVVFGRRTFEHERDKSVIVGSEFAKRWAQGILRNHYDEIITYFLSDRCQER